MNLNVVNERKNQQSNKRTGYSPKRRVYSCDFFLQNFAVFARYFFLVVSTTTDKFFSHIFLILAFISDNLDREQTKILKTVGYNRKD